MTIRKRTVSLPGFEVILSDPQWPTRMQRLFVQFNVGRGHYRIAGPPVAASAAFTGGDGAPAYLNTFDVTGAIRDAGKAANLTVHELGEPIEYVRYIGIFVGGVVVLFERVIGETSDKCGHNALYSSRLPRPGEFVFFGPPELRMALENGPGFRSEDPAITSARRFFMNLDLLTHPALTPADMTEAISNFKAYLENRLFSRANRTDPTFKAPCADKIIDLFSGLACRSGLGGLAGLSDAIERFANGELRWYIGQAAPDPVGSPGAYVEWLTQPSSAQFFLFGEMALFAAEQDEATWLEPARAMVAAQEVFLAAYERIGDTDYFGNYSGCAYKGPLSPGQRAMILATYRGLGLDELAERAGCNARTACLHLGKP